ncbi:MAG: molybdopterin-dependent oxidoreductase [Bryobacterales bacterium]|nr:molybdopterin-dependent oxidoreductase [Bryobacterales bacterium]
MERGSWATCAGLAIHYAAFRAGWIPLWPEAIGEWIMARTPNDWALAILSALGEWAKPFAVTGGLAALGFLATTSALIRGWPMLPAAIALSWGASRFFEYGSLAGQAAFWAPALAVLLWRPAAVTPNPARRAFLGLLMAGTTGAVAAESFSRNRAMARRAVDPVELFPFSPPPDTFAPGFVRPAVTSVRDFYLMSKNAVDPAIDPGSWRLRITANGRLLWELSYTELLSAPRIERYSTMRCVSNTLKTNLMGTALWSGLRMGQLVDPGTLPRDIVEVAFLGVDGHGDSLPLDYGVSDEILLALGMNGRTLNRGHGFPIRLVAPRYYGFKSVKWLSEIAFVSEPYFGTWPRMGYTKEPRVHTGSSIDRAVRDGGTVRVGGVSFAGTRGISAVEVRADDGPWHPAQLDTPLSAASLTRWYAEIGADPGAREVEARARDGEGNWQAAEPSPLFPSGVSGPTRRRISA